MLFIKSSEIKGKGLKLYGKVKYDNPKIPKAVFVVASFVDNVTVYEQEFDNYQDADLYFDEVLNAN